ncbi:MAG: alpha/beta fold hydrolase [Myxococcales bacterium]|nr:alpha/beta fold hydrolase [Myxococcales bacterium]
MIRRSALLLLLPVFAASCLTMDAFLFNGMPVDEYRWDDDNPCDPQLEGDFVYVAREQGKSAGCHPSLVPPASRIEDFVDADGVAIHYVYAHHGDAPTTTILYSHGNHHHMGSYWDRVEQLWGWGYNVLIYDYPGYGRSEGETSEAGIYASAQAAAELLPTLPGVDPDRVFFYGYSLGGAPTFELALRAEQGDLAVKPRALATEAAWCNLDIMIGEATYIGMDKEYLLSFDFDSCRKLAELDPQLPLMILHGTEDTTVQIENARALARAAPGEAELHIVEGGEHYDLPLFVPEDYESWMRGFFDR